MEDFLKSARKQLEELDLQAHLKDVDLGKQLKNLDLEKFKDIDVKKQRKALKKQLKQADVRKREDEAASEGFLGGFLLGVVVGAILALIFAPKAGSETRELVAEKAGELKHKAEGLVGQASNEVEESDLASTLSDEPAIEREIGDIDGETRSTKGVI
jgi:gas vesicle protein